MINDSYTIKFGHYLTLVIYLLVNTFMYCKFGFEITVISLLTMIEFYLVLNKIADNNTKR